jgi:predicted phage terminase large subunit-like protein
MNCLQFVEEPGYAALLLRRTLTDLSLPSALMDRAAAWLAGTPAIWSDKDKTWRFPSGATLTFGFLDTINDKFRYQSSEFQFIGFDELTQFLEDDYRYLFSRLRRLKGSPVPLRMRAASNPGGIGHDWVKQRFLNEGPAKGRVYVPARLEDNPHLDRQEYEASLNELDPVTRAQLLAGDWSVRQGGSIFRQEWFPMVENEPPNLHKIRSWDLAATEARPGTDPDWTVGVLMGRSPVGCFYILDVRRVRATPQGVENLVLQTAEQDGRGVRILLEQEPGSSGKSLVQHYAKMLAGWPISADRQTGDKVTRASPFSSQVEAGRVYLLRAPWNTAFLDELEAFPHYGSHDDQVDAASAAFNRLCLGPNTVHGRLLCSPSVEDADRVRLALDGEDEVFRFVCPCGHGYNQHNPGGGSCEACECPRYRGHVSYFRDDESDGSGFLGPLR